MQVMFEALLFRENVGAMLWPQQVVKGECRAAEQIGVAYRARLSI